MKSLQLNTTLARRMIVDFIRVELTRVGFTRGILGLSGGVDS